MLFLAKEAEINNLQEELAHRNQVIAELRRTVGEQRAELVATQRALSMLAVAASQPEKGQVHPAPKRKAAKSSRGKGKGKVKTNLGKGQQKKHHGGKQTFMDRLDGPLTGDHG